jgi:leucyl-tRNA synthetase
MISPGTPDDEIERIALEDQRIKGFIGKKAIKKVIIVKSKLVNIVIGQ